ncbi:MAG: hypothetical protein IT359_10580 [Gemmatimonadaceae bacterium]|nr:hypothetical protein [Gemmatimonadaceae bacterium]
MWRAAIGGAIILAGVAMHPPVAGAQGARAAWPLSPSSTLTASARLRSTAVAVSVELTQPAILLPLGYHEERGWFLLEPFASLPVRAPGEQTVQYPRKSGPLVPPSGTGSGSPDYPPAGLGCGAAGGVVNPATGHCGMGGSETIGLATDVGIGPADYRAVVVRVSPGFPAAALDSVLRATNGRPPMVGLTQLARALSERDSTAAWALVRVPRG